MTGLEALQEWQNGNENRSSKIYRAPNKIPGPWRVILQNTNIPLPDDWYIDPYQHTKCATLYIHDVPFAEYDGFRQPKNCIFYKTDSCGVGANPSLDDVIRFAVTEANGIGL